MEKLMIYVRALFQFLFVLIAGVSIGLCANGFIVRFQEPMGCSSAGSANAATPSYERKAEEKSLKRSAKIRALAATKEERNPR